MRSSLEIPGATPCTPQNPGHGRVAAERSEAIECSSTQTTSAAFPARQVTDQPATRPRHHDTAARQRYASTRCQPRTGTLVRPLPRVYRIACPWCDALPCICGRYQGHARPARDPGMRRRVSLLSQGRRKPLMRMACENPVQIMTRGSRRDRGVDARAEAHPAHPPAGGLAVPSSGDSAKRGSPIPVTPERR
jgi:hypothetical protein